MDIREVKRLFGLVEIDFCPEELYCKICDQNHVEPGVPESGKFYSMFGTVYHYDFKKSSRSLGNYVQVIVAICADCGKDIPSIVSED